MDLPVLTDGRVTLRPAEPGETARLIEALASDEEARPWFGSDPVSLRRWLEDPEVSVLVVEYEHEAVGLITFEEQDDPDYRSAGIDIGLLSCCVGRGLGTAALTLLAGWLIDARGHHRLTIDPAAANARAIRAYEKVGFRRVGVMREYERGPDGVWRDSVLMDLLARELVR